MAGDTTHHTAPALTAAELWAATLADLERNLALPTFDTWLRSTEALSLDDATLTVVASTPYAHDWLNTRLKPLVERTAGRIVDRPIAVTFTDPGAPPQLEAGDYRPDAHARVFDFDPKSRGYQIVPAYDGLIAHGHDDLLVSAAMTAVLDTLTSGPADSTVVPASDSLRTYDAGDW